jgi:predicted RNA-binding Zn-ribbon protein involved in translation (DUF1610 family)
VFAVTEVRFARRVPQLCTTCGRTIDEEDHTRTFIADRHTTTTIHQCRDCRPLHR